MFRHVVYGFIALCLAGCSVTHPAVTEYRIAPEVSLQRSVTCNGISLRVLSVIGDEKLMQQKMYYVRGNYEQGEFHRSAWSQSLNKMIESALLRSIEDAKIFEGVYSYQSIKKADIALESRVNQFMQYFDEDAKKSKVKVDITMRIIDVKSNTQIATKRFVQELDTQSNDAKGGVIALNEAYKKVLQDVVVWLQGSCQ